MMTLEEAKTLKINDRLIILVDTCGSDENDEEQTYLAGAYGRVFDLETYRGKQGFAVHVVIGNSDNEIINVFDENDNGGLYPFRRV